MTTTATPVLNQAKIEQFTHQIIGDLGAAMSAVLIRIGDRLGLYRALGDSRPVTPADLAAKTSLAERYVREWLHNQAAAGWVTYDPRTATFTLPAEHALLLADEHSPAYLLGGFDIAAAVWADEDILASAFRTGAGIGWHQHDSRLFSGTERFFRPGYQANLVSSWLPAVDGIVQRLQQGIAVADVGCGFGASTVLLAQHYPNSTFAGFDYHDASIAAARGRAAEAGVVGNVSFEVSGAQDFPGQYDLICLFDCLHDMGDPVGAARQVREALDPDGTWMIVEPMAGDRVEDNLNPVGRAMYGFSTFLCTPASLSQEVGLALGAQAGEARLGEVVAAAGFTHFRRAAETPFNLVLEARP